MVTYASPPGANVTPLGSGTAVVQPPQGGTPLADLIQDRPYAYMGVALRLER